ELEAEALRDTLDENFDLELYVDVTPWPRGAPRLARITVHPAEIWLPLTCRDVPAARLRRPTGASLQSTQQYSAEMIDQYGNPIDAKLAWSAAPGGQIDTGTAYGAGNWFDERKLPGEAKIDAAGLLASTGKPGVVTVTAAAPDQPDVKGTAIVCIGDWPSINPASRAILRIGADNSYGKGFSGDIDRIRIYNRALPADELARHASGAGLDTADGLVADWTFDELTGGVYPNTAAPVAAGDGLAAKPLHLDPGKAVQQLNEAGRRFIRLDGRAYLDVDPDPRLDFCRRATIEAWIRTAGSRAIQGGTIVSKQIVWMWGFVFYAESGGLGCDALRTDTRWLNAPFAFSADTWTHVAAVFDVNGHWLLYANGKLIGEKKPHTLNIR
ncbi:MAG TPA: LamG-like jellyroll fold domain-containing protein, partial [Planctomycetota bacterium]|nr:LamG-like jellyroll fold domain-containing protein [Planctomycetota bacterium]